MCGRYHFGVLPDKKGKQIKDRSEKLNLVYKQGEIFPTDNILCIIPKESRIDLSVKKWGIKAKSLLINARMETLQDRPTYNAIKNNRCAVICNGFYEWDKDKNKYYISFEDEYMYLACIFNDNDELVILTKSAGDDFRHIHDRIPLIMNQNEMNAYIHNIDALFTSKKLIINEMNEELSLF